jgi:MoaA/NifB/PqqE/SkfB family radical SAM enzyme
MLTEEAHSASVLEEKIAVHEDAAHEKRNWVRLTYDCNNRCIFCLDSDTHDGEIRDAEDVKRQILDGRKKGATRLILSGGEPTIHPRYVDFVKLGRLAGYRRIQTVTNGRLFAYQEFLDRCIEAGLSEITFSLHGPNARIHDALVGVKGAFEQESAGLRRALADGRAIVNVDIVINRGNVKVLPEMLETFYGWGVREFDLLQVVPFGRAFTEGRETLFYDLEEAAPYLRQALAFSQRKDVHVWLNRFPPPHLEGFEHLIQDPYKLNDEVRGRKEEFLKQLEHGTPLECRDPGRCKYCYLERLCDVLEDVQRTVHEETFERVRIDTMWEATIPQTFGGDPASARRSQDGRRHLPLAGSAVVHRPIAERVERAGATRFVVRAPSIERALLALAPFASARAIELELDDYTGLREALDGDRLGAGVLARATAANVAQAEQLLALDASFEVEVLLTRETGAWLEALAEVPARLALRQPTYERLTEASDQDLDLPAFFRRFTHEVPVEGVTACVLGRAPRKAPRTLDTAMMEPGGRLEIFRYTRRYVLSGYTSKSLRCRGCKHDASCDGLHINQVRAHGYAWLTPIA